MKNILESLQQRQNQFLFRNDLKFNYFITKLKKSSFMVMNLLTLVHIVAVQNGLFMIFNLKKLQYNFVQIFQDNIYQLNKHQVHTKMQATPLKIQQIDNSDREIELNPQKNQSQPSLDLNNSNNSLKQDIFTEKDLEYAADYNVKKYWSEQEDKKLLTLAQNTNYDWSQIAKSIQGRTENMCYNRYRRLLMKSPYKNWKKEDEELLKDLVQRHGKKWKTISLYFPNRTPKQLRQRYLNFLREGIDKSDWTPQQQLKILNLIKANGKKWKSFEKELPGRTENQIKSRFYGKLYRIYEQKQKESFEK